MDQKVLDYVIEKTHELMKAESCSGEAKQAAQAWLDAIGSESQKEETKKYLAELEADIIPIDGLISFAESAHGVEVFGAEMAKTIGVHAQEIKAAGAKYCDCPACAVVAEILEKKETLLNS